MHYKKKTLFILGLILLLVVHSLHIPKVEAAINEQPIHDYSQNTWAFSSLAKGPNGEIYLAHKVNYTTISIKKWDGSKWIPFSTITTAETNNTSFSDDLDLTVDSLGKIHIVFRHVDGTGIPSARGISYGYFNGTNWVFNKVETSSDPNGWKNYDDPSIAVDSNGKAHIVYNYTDSNGSRIYSAKYATNVSGKWDISTLVVGDGPIGIDEIHQPQIEIDGSDIAHVTYVREDNQNNYYGNYYYTSKQVIAPTFPPAAKIVDAIADGKNYYYSPFAVDASGKIFFTSNASVNNSSTSYLHSNTTGSWLQEQIYTDNQRETYPVGVSIVDSTVYLLMYSVAKDWSNIQLFAIAKNDTTLIVGNKFIKPDLVVSPPLDETTFLVDSNGNFMTVMEHNELKTISSLYGTSADFGLSETISTNSELNNLTISNGTLSPAFSANTTSYSASVANNVSTIGITPTLADSKSTLTVNGSTATNGQPVNVSLSEGANTITVTVTAEDGVTTKTYTVTINRATPTAPSAPTNVRATATNEQASISFDAPTDNGGKPITAYKVKVYSGGVEQTSLNTTGTSSPITVSGLTNGTPYTFKVVASNEIGDSNTSVESPTVTPKTIPGAPTIGNASQGNGQATVSFTAPASNGGSAIAGYTVTANPGGFTANGSNSPITVTGLTNGISYTFTVTATNAAGTSTASQASNSVIPATVPNAPMNVVVTPGDKQAKVSFDSPTENGGNIITGYKVKVYSGGVELPLFNKRGSTSPITVTGLTNGTPYTFKVAAENLIGEGPESTISSEVTPSSVPDAPTGINVIKGNAKATVSFTPPTNNGGNAITSYTVKVFKDGTEQTSLNKSGSTSPITVTGLTNGTSYTFKVVATNIIGDSANSEETSSITPATIPDSPTLISAIAGNKEAKISFTPPSNNGGSTITSYTVTSNPGGLTATGTTSPITLTGLTNGVTYTFTVTASNSEGTSLPSVSSQSVVPSDVPDPPTNVSAVAGNTEAVVSFDTPLNNGGNSITGYTVKVFKDGTDQTSLNKSGSTSPITVTGLTNGTSYTFKVVATNNIGDSVDSEASTSIVPMTVPDKPTNIITTSGDGQVKIDFTPPINNGGSSITEYVVKVFENGVEQVSLNKSGTGSPITVSNLTNGTPYTFKVIAKNIVGESAASDETAQVTPAANQLAPIGLTGIAPTNSTSNDGKIMGTSNLMEYKLNSDTIWVSVSGTEIQNLSPGTYHVRLKATPGFNAGAVTNVIVPNYVSPGGGGSGGSGGSGNSGGGNTNTEDNTNILINGKKVSLGQSKTITVDNKTITTLTVDATKLKELLKQAGKNAVVTIPVDVESDRIIGKLNGEIIRYLEVNGGTVVLQTPTATYTLPAQQINIDDIANQLGKNVELKDILIQIEISEPTDQSIQVIQDTASKNGYSILVQPVEFKISYTNGDKTGEAGTFNAYVERMIAIPEGIDPSRITTGIRLNADGTFSHVPTSIIKIDGKYYAKINSLTNSTYTVISSPKEFKDVATHWAKRSIHNLASRLIISGVTKDNFAPNNDITRAEFTAIMVRGLGIKLGVGENVYEDVATDSWYTDYILAATEYDLIHGYGNGNFGANDKITRQQAIAIIARAMKITKLHDNLTDEEVNLILEQFGDDNKIADYAKEPIALAVKTGVVSGKSNQTIAPQDYITRAEVVVIIERLLQKSNLINK